MPKPSSLAHCTLGEDHYCKHCRFSHRETPLANSCCQSFHPHSISLPVSQFLTDSAVAKAAAAALLVCHCSLQYHFMYAHCRGTLPYLPGTGSIIHPYYMPYPIHSPSFQKLSSSLLGCWSQIMKPILPALTSLNTLWTECLGNQQIFTARMRNLYWKISFNLQLCFAHCTQERGAKSRVVVKGG